ncbi:MAG: hypothetical protein N3G21_10155 [Candidatus Hydrogenedentes bacterium]|nr:hypothetical protein [Candidatus Hydrogenedentota bacterium]
MGSEERICFARRCEIRGESKWIHRFLYFGYDDYDVSMFIPKISFSYPQENFWVNLILCIFLWVLVVQLDSFSADLIVGSVSLKQGEKIVVLPVDIKVKPGEKVSGVQFDITMPFEFSVKEARLGESAQKANKMCTYNKINSYTCRVIVAGLNRDVLDEGTLVFIKFELTDIPTGGKHRIKLSNVVLADPDGNSVVCVVQPGGIVVGGDLPDNNTATVPSPPIKSSFGSEDNRGKSLLLWIIFIAVVTIVIFFILYIVFRKSSLFNNNQGYNIKSRKKKKESKSNFR